MYLMIVSEFLCTFILRINNVVEVFISTAERCDMKLVQCSFTYIYDLIIAMYELIKWPHISNQLQIYQQSYLFINVSHACILRSPNPPRHTN